ncbi:hypothetical protein NM688_g1615 [Phlebia brevispora]|uniref:Uncharacterized protein n=1 Tax=Phlebia brevispora TaxID=194682 RepID=A0ACC1TB71_9APHY|nr:hypothetical protein NM688_g1615 [Phlebia brevispora]
MPPAITHGDIPLLTSDLPPLQCFSWSEQNFLSLGNHAARILLIGKVKTLALRKDKRSKQPLSIELSYNTSQASDAKNTLKIFSSPEYAIQDDDLVIREHAMNQLVFTQIYDAKKRYGDKENMPLLSEDDISIGDVVIVETNIRKHEVTQGSWKAAYDLVRIGIVEKM